MKEKSAKMRKPINVLFVAYLALYALMLALACSACRTPRDLPGGTIIKDSVVYKDTTVFVKIPPIVIPGEKVTLHDSVPCPDVQWKAKNESGRTTIDAEINNGYINISCKTDSLVHEIDSLKALIKVKEGYRSTVVTNVVTVKDWYIPRWVWLVVVACALIVFVALKK
jgi:hypothetical protein